MTDTKDHAASLQPSDDTMLPGSVHSPASCTPHPCVSTSRISHRPRACDNSPNNSSLVCESTTFVKGEGPASSANLKDLENKENMEMASLLQSELHGKKELQEKLG
ncbi:golgin subfamily A member 2-like [Pongo pygmaeus]|uniref:golgin subfamily A member 2-like n=1 Tax=Pongo pygmaeus TaxID=9600 RepID=UPI00300DB476